MTARLTLALALAATGCAAPPAAPTPPTVAGTPPAPATTQAPTTTAAPAATAPPPTSPTTGAGRAVQVARTEPERSEPNNADDAFWRRLADCECASGACGGAHVSYFQFSRDTARKVGIDGSEPYEEQRAAAQEWARRIHPGEGTRSGWPVCWWRAAA